MEATIKVQVAGNVKEYPADGGKVVGLFEAQRQGKAFFRTNRDNALKAVAFWVIMDDSGLAYRVEVSRTGNHQVMAAAPLPGPNNVRELYVA